VNQIKSLIKLLITLLLYISLSIPASADSSVNDNSFFHEVAQYICMNSEQTQSDSVDVFLTKNEIKKGTGEKYVSPEDFRYADNPRYLITGDMPLAETHIRPLAMGIMVGVYGTIFYFQHVGQMNTIWKDRGPFRIIEDGRYALYADKAGHIFGGYFSSYVMSESMMLSGFSYDASAIWGGVAGLAYETYVEILDGFGKEWGFSPTDWYADIFGVSLFVAQHFVPYLQNFTVKFMYIPSPWIGENKRVPSDMFIDDYSSHTIFLSANIHNMLPKDLKDFWPSWLQLSVGYAARNLCSPFPPSQCDKCKSEQIYSDVWGSPKFIVALDYDLVKILPDGGYVWNWFKQSLNYFKLPSPAIEFGAVTKVYLMYPFPIKIGNIRF